MTDLKQISIDIILDNQHPGGSYPASPTFPTYRYSWFRDGAFIAYAMDLVGEHESAARFHQWAADNINRRATVVQSAVSKAASGLPLQEEDILHTRYSVSGEEASEDWPNFQLDGFGTWLWALDRHLHLADLSPNDGLRRATALTADYLTALWQRPCFDCWEEFPDQVHTYTLGAVNAGLTAAGLITGNKDGTPAEIRNFLLTKAVSNGHFSKYVGSDQVDASLVGLSTPYEIFSGDHPILERTIAEIDRQLAPDTGTHRYTTDSYYGGGEWVLLTAWLGWHYARNGMLEKAGQALDWIEDCADSHGNLAEQLPKNLNNPAAYEPWKSRWGEIANPLLWSHAMYLILHNELNSEESSR